MVMNIKNEELLYWKESPIAIKIYSAAHYTAHYHAEACEMIYCLSGKVNLVSGHQRVTLCQGELFTLDYDDIHCLYSEGGNLLLSVHLNLKKLNYSWDYLKDIYFSCKTTACRPHQIKPMEKVCDIILALAYEYAAGSKITCGELTNVSNELIGLLVRYFDWFNYMNTIPNPNDELHERFLRIYSYCNQNYMHKITISQLAKAEYINENYFSQFMRNSSFKGFRHLINYIRCYQAERLILMTDLPAAEIAHRCGFSDPKYYYRSFKDWWGTSPLRHKNWYKDFAEHSERIRIYSPEEVLKTIEPFIAAFHCRKMLHPQ